MNEQIVIRADADSKIGIGHMMRCMALAQTWREKGSHVAFITHCPEDHLRKSIIQGGFGFIPVESPFPDRTDLIFTLGKLKELEGSNERVGRAWVVLDGYHFTPDYQRAVREKGFRLIVIDDMAHLSHYHTDILINQNIHASQFEYICDEDTLKLLGTGYALLRHDFYRFRGWHRNIPEKAKNMLVTFGGSDKRDLTRMVLESFNELGDKDLNVIVLTGRGNLHGDKLLPNTKLLSYVEDMPSLLSWADLAISACGITSLEAAFMGLPSIVFTVEKNQAGIGERLHDLGVAHHIGEPVDMEPEFIRDNINSLILDRGRRREMSEKGRNLVDGRGAEKVHRLIHYLGGGEIDIKECIRMAENGDCVPLWRLANEKEVRKNSFSRGPFPLNTHRSWFEDKLKSPDTLLFVLDIGGQIAGQIRYERSGSEASVHFSLAPAFRGRGLARKMIECTFKKACEILEVESVKGIVKDFNGPSIKTFFKTGFIRTGSMDISGEAATIFKKACH